MDAFETFMYDHPVIMLLVYVSCPVIGWIIADALWKRGGEYNESDED